VSPLFFSSKLARGSNYGSIAFPLDWNSSSKVIRAFLAKLDHNESAIGITSSVILEIPSYLTISL